MVKWGEFRQIRFLCRYSQTLLQMPLYTPQGEIVMDTKAPGTVRIYRIAARREEEKTVSSVV